MCRDEEECPSSSNQTVVFIGQHSVVCGKFVNLRNEKSWFSNLRANIKHQQNTEKKDDVSENVEEELLSSDKVISLDVKISPNLTDSIKSFHTRNMFPPIWHPLIMVVLCPKKHLFLAPPSRSKQKHQLVVRCTSWCFVFLWPRHVFMKYFFGIIKIHQEQKKHICGTCLNLTEAIKKLLSCKSNSWGFDA